MTDKQPPKPTPKQAVLATFRAIQKILGDPEYPRDVALTMVEALARKAWDQMEAVQELKQPRREKKVGA